jgi:2-iminobutanoate/2-iminopropanoate deaminase
VNPVSTDDAPSAIGPYSQAVVHGGLVYCSGQVGVTPDGRWAGDTPALQAAQALANLGAVLKAAGSAPDQVIRTMVFLVDMDDFAAVNAVYAAFFGNHRPARACVEAAALPKGALVEIDCVAAV